MKMLNKYIFVYFVFIPVLVFSLIGGCGGGDGSTDTVTDATQKVIVEGTVSETDAATPAEQKITFINRLKNIIRLQ